MHKQPPYQFSRTAQQLIASFRGIPHQPYRYTQPARCIDEAITCFLQKIDLENHHLQHHLAMNWSDIVGAKLADKCTPVGLNRKKNQVIVRAHNPIVKTELEFDKKRITATIQRYCPKETITSVMIKL